MYPPNTCRYVYIHKDRQRQMERLIEIDKQIEPPSLYPALPSCLALYLSASLYLSVCLSGAIYMPICLPVYLSLPTRATLVERDQSLSKFSSGPEKKSFFFLSSFFFFYLDHLAAIENRLRESFEEMKKRKFTGRKSTREGKKKKKTKKERFFFCLRGEQKGTGVWLDLVEVRQFWEEKILPPHLYPSSRRLCVFSGLE